MKVGDRVRFRIMQMCADQTYNQGDTAVITGIGTQPGQEAFGVRLAFDPAGEWLTVSPTAVQVIQ